MKRPAPTPSPIVQPIIRRPIPAIKIDKTATMPITVICVHYRTPQLAFRAIMTFIQYYPSIPIIFVDNHSPAKEVAKLKKQFEMFQHIRWLDNDNNIGHGPAMNRAVKQVETSHFFTLDTDTEVIKGGFLERMIRAYKKSPSLYAIGWLRWVNKDGVASPVHDSKKYLRYIHPYAALFDRAKYLALRPFEFHGAPCYTNMWDAREAGYKVKNFDIQAYVKHLGAGTRRMWKGAWDPKDKPPTQQWRAKDNYPL